MTRVAGAVVGGAIWVGIFGYWIVSYFVVSLHDGVTFDGFGRQLTHTPGLVRLLTFGFLSDWRGLWWFAAEVLLTGVVGGVARALIQLGRRP